MDQGPLNRLIISVTTLSLIVPSVEQVLLPEEKTFMNDALKVVTK